MADEANDTGPLSLADAVSAYANLPTDDEAETGQSEADGTLESDTADEELPEADAEGEDVDGEPDDDGQADEGDQESDDAGKFVSPKGKVKLPDGSTVSVDELIKGNLRDGDYRRKTMELADSRKAHEAQSATVKQKETQLAEQADYMVRLLETIVPKAPDAAMATNDPLAYMQQEAAHKQWMQHLTYLRQQQQQAQQAGQAEAAANEKATADREWGALLEKASDLKDAGRLKAFATDITKHGAEYGFTPQEIARVALDHRQALVLKDAIAWRKLQANKGKIAVKTENRPPVQRGGTRQSPGVQNVRQTRAAMDRLNSSGKLADGVAALLALEKQG